MAMDYPALDHSIVHGAAHGARVRIVDDDEIDQAVQLFQLLFPHEHVVRMSLGCRHTCVYTSNASAGDIAAVLQHYREVQSVG
jgi:hypothetical protein